MAQRLFSEDPKIREEAWAEFLSHYVNKIENIISNSLIGKYGASAIEEVRDGVLDRLQNDLKKYEGRCSLLGFLFRPIKWVSVDWLRKRGTVVVESLDQLSEAGREIGEEDRGSTAPAEPSVSEDDVILALSQETTMVIGGALARLDPEARWVFLLRFYNDFEFPPSEIRALAQARRMPVGEISRRLTKIFVEDDVLARKRLKLTKQEERLAKLWRKILSGKETPDTAISPLGFVLTPYEAIGYILGIKKISTLRGRFLEARKFLRGYLEGQGIYFS